MRRFGIDLGTTNTCIYMVNFPLGGTKEDVMPLRVDIVYEKTGDLFVSPRASSMPSVIYGRRRSDTAEEEYDFLLGEVAQRQAKMDGASSIINTKRLLVTENASTKIQYGLTAQDIAQKLLEGCYYSIKKSSLSDRQISSSKFCITQPAAFGLFASRSIQDAAEPAGFVGAETQKEPHAALLSFLYGQLKNTDTAEQMLNRQREHGNRLLTLVVDIGGGTTDVTIQEIEISGSEEPEQGSTCCTGYKIKFLNLVKQDSEANAPVAAANQEPAFGGYDFDKCIVAHIVKEWDKQYEEQTGNKYNWNSTDGNIHLSDLYQRVQHYKNSLSEFFVDYQMERNEEENLDNVHVSCRVNADLVYQWTQNLCEPAEGQVEEGRPTVYGIIADTIRRSGYHVDDIDYFYVTGGMSRYKPIRDMIKRRFAKLDESQVLVFSEDPLADIAKGAALCNLFFEVEMPQNTLFADLMIDDPCGEPKILVTKNSPLPAKGLEKNFMELRNPAYLYLDVLWGDGTKDCAMQRLKRLRQGLPNGRTTELGTKVSVEWEIDQHQAMDIVLIVHDRMGDYRIALLRLIRKDFSRGGEDA